MHSLSLFDKLWTKHVVCEVIDGPSLIYIDKHLINEVTSAQAFDGLRSAAREPWRSGSIIATSDHNVPTVARAAGIIDPISRMQVDTLSQNCATHNITYFGMTDLRQGILHVVAPEQGMTLPGTTVVCGDSHTSTHGAFAALAFGIGTSEVEQVLASQTLYMPKPKSIRICIDGERHPGVTAKDLALAVIRRIGTAGGTGGVIEFAGATVAALSMEARMTLCNMAIEAGARAGMIGVDDTTLAYLKGRSMSPAGAAWQQAEAYWRTLVSDPAARFDQELTLGAATVHPLVTWGTSPEMVASIDEVVPDPAHEPDPVRRESMVRALTYMGLEPNTPIKANQPRYQGATVLLARTNFGCGSSREHAPWALREFGLRTIIAPSFADIFANNCTKNGLLPLTLPAAVVDALFRDIDVSAGFMLAISLDEQTVTTPSGRVHRFEFDAFRKRCLLDGVSEIDLAL